MTLTRHCMQSQNKIEVIPLNRCVIITSFQSAPIKESFQFLEDDFIICADGGYSFALAEKIDPDLIIGDFDSIDVASMEESLKTSGLGDRCQVITLSKEKDDTDTLFCIKYGISHGFKEFVVLGGLGGRLDHTIANLQAMSYAIDQQRSIWFLDGKNRATMRNPGSIAIDEIPGSKISLMSFTDYCEGVSIQGVKYPLENHLLNNSFPLGVSNEFLEKKIEVSHRSGKLLIILSQD